MRSIWLVPLQIWLLSAHRKGYLLRTVVTSSRDGLDGLPACDPHRPCRLPADTHGRVPGLRELVGAKADGPQSESEHGRVPDGESCSSRAPGRDVSMPH